VLINVIEGVLGIIKQETKADLPASYIRVFLKIASEPSGITQSDLAEELGSSQMSISRACKMLSVYADKGELKGLNLITQHPDITHRRRLACSLTPEGVSLLNIINDCIRTKTAENRMKV
jgi:DNA-binding MarR family transcriptional regulator